MADTDIKDAMVEVDKELAAIVRAGCFASEAEAVREAVQTLFAVKPHLRVEAAMQRYLDEEITLGRAAELAGVTRWRLQELLAQRGFPITYEARPTKELNTGVERLYGEICMSSHPQVRLTPEEYVAIERQATYKSEYVNGKMFAMAGASPRHVLIVTNVVAELRTQLKRRPCTVYSTDLRLQVRPTGLYTYPDVIVVCGQPQFDDEQHDTLLNPTVIVEVLSDSTQDYDRGGKFEHYRTLASLTEYVLIAQDKYHVEHFIRQPDNRWLLAETNRIEDTIQLPAIACALALVEIYDKVDTLGGAEEA